MHGFSAVMTIVVSDVGYLNENNAWTAGGSGNDLYPSNLYADLSTATAATINQLRQSFQIQKLLERDGRGGPRYTEIVRSHFSVFATLIESLSPPNNIQLVYLS